MYPLQPLPGYACGSGLVQVPGSGTHAEGSLIIERRLVCGLYDAVNSVPRNDSIATIKHHIPRIAEPISKSCSFFGGVCLTVCLSVLEIDRAARGDPPRREALACCTERGIPPLMSGNAQPNSIPKLVCGHHAVMVGGQLNDGESSTASLAVETRSSSWQ